MRVEFVVRTAAPRADGSVPPTAPISLVHAVSHAADPALEASTLVELLRARAAAAPDRRAYVFLEDGENEGASLTFGELDRAARAVAAELQARGLAGERALLLFPAGLDFVVAFCGCLYAGVVAVPAPAPEASQFERTLPRLTAMARDSRPAVVLTNSEHAGSAQTFTERVDSLHGVAGCHHRHGRE